MMNEPSGRNLNVPVAFVTMVNSCPGAGKKALHVHGQGRIAERGSAAHVESIVAAAGDAALHVDRERGWPSERHVRRLQDPCRGARRHTARRNDTDRHPQCRPCPCLQASCL